MADSHKTQLERGIEKVVPAFKEFVQAQTTSSMLLLGSAVVAMWLANSPFAAVFESVLEFEVGVQFGAHTFSADIHHWINDGLMVLFFFILGLEIKREFLAGELSDLKQASLVIMAAVGGMVAPALIFLALNAGGPGAGGWGIPMATDTAFAVGVLALLGKRIPRSLIVFLVALAIIDDLGAVTVIAVFYSGELATPYLLLSVLFVGFMALLNIAGVRRPGAYLVGGVLVWFAVLNSGLHATVAGILVALTVPARPKHGAGVLTRRLPPLVQEVQRADGNVLRDRGQHQRIQEIEETAEKATTPLRRWENALELPVALLILPLFALANAGVPISPSGLVDLASSRVAVGVGLGLVLGKVVGITAMCWVGVRLGLGALPKDAGFRHIAGVGLVAGIGFTMSVFIAHLGFSGQPEMLLAAKTSILLASLIAGTAGYLWLRYCSAVQSH